MDIATQVKALKFPAGSFAVFGSGPLAARGLREARDADIVVTEPFFKELAKDPSWIPGELPDHHKSLQKGEVTVYYSWAPGSWDVAELIRDADVINGVPYVKLESVQEWKELRALPKDVADIELIKRFLSVQK